MNKTLLTAAALSLALVGVGTFSFLANGQEEAATHADHQMESPIAGMKQFVVHGNYVHFASAEELTNFADVVVVGSPEKHFQEDKSVVTYNQEGRYEDFYTVSNVKVQKVLKGDYAAKTIEVTQPAVITESISGNKEKLFMIQDDFSVMEKEHKYLLFLKKMDNGKYSIISVNQGKFNIDGQDKKEQELDTHLEQHKQLREDVMKKFKGKL